MFVKELGKKAGVPSVYTLPFCMLGQWKFKVEKFELGVVVQGLYVDDSFANHCNRGVLVNLVANLLSSEWSK